MSAVPGDLINRELYPDLVERGGLAPAIDAVARANGVNLGEISTQPADGRYLTADVDSARGVVRVVLGATMRRFSITIAATNHIWARGGTSDIRAVVRVADVWRKGVGVEELRDRFPFMRLDPLAVAYERGDPVAEQWAQTLGDPDLTEIQTLLVATHSDPRLRSLFPVVSHLTLLRLLRDHDDRVTGEVWITKTSGGYLVEDPRVKDKYSVPSVEEAIAIAASLV